MSQGDASHESVEASGESGRQDDSGGGVASRLSERVRTGARSGALAGLGGGVTVLRGVRAIRAGDRARGVRRLAVGAALVAVAAVQRRSGEGSSRRAGERIDIDESDVVDTGPDIEGAAGESSSGPPHASGDEASSVVDTGTDVSDAVSSTGDEDETETTDAAAVSDTRTDVTDAVSTGEGEASADEAEADESVERWAEESAEVAEESDESESESEEPESESEGWETEESESEAEESEAEELESEAEESESEESGAGEAGATDYDRLGEAAFDGESNEVPVPQRAFNQQSLALDAEAVWGIRESDGAVVVSQLYDPIEENEDTRYVGSSQTDEERAVQVPDEILDHWEDEAGGPVEGGDDIVFATADDLEDDSQLLVVPTEMAEDLIDEE